jgi:hypothetical protein
MSFLWDSNAIAQGFWQGVFQLLALALVAAFGTFIYQRVRSLYTQRAELIEEINQFAISLYKPRKLYQAIIDHSCDPLAASTEPGQREARRLDLIYGALEELVAATGRFRALQVKMIPLYGHDLELFAYYMAIWRYLKEIRHRMERGQTLLTHEEKADSQDAFYMLIDGFRYRIILQGFVWRAPGLARPTREVLDAMRRKGDEVYAQYFLPPGK